MLPEEFHLEMVRLDRNLAEKGMPANIRMLHVFFRMSGLASLDLPFKCDPTLSPYEGVNLMQSIENWYKQHYPAHVICVPDFGKRPLIIRGEVLSLKLPLIFNGDPEKLCAMQYVEDAPPSLVSILDDDEKAAVQDKFNHFFKQASRLALLTVLVRRSHNWPNAGLVKDLILSARADLNSAAAAAQPGDPGAYSWCSQQAVEKSLKAYLALSDPKMNSERMKKHFGHNLAKLLAECCKHSPVFNQVLPFAADMSVAPEARYESPNRNVVHVIYTIDLAFATCDLVTRVMIDGIRMRE
jgi:hypothetical protein